MQDGRITSTPTPRIHSALPSVPQVPLLLHPHKPLLFSAHGSCMRLFNYETQQWELDEVHHLQEKPQQRVTLPAADNPLVAGEQRGQPQQQQQQTRHTMDIAAADCVCLDCGRRSTSVPVFARVPCRNANSSNCVWLTAGDDKTLCLWRDNSFELLQRRMQRKKASAACFVSSAGPWQRRRQGQEGEPLHGEHRMHVLLCDKFGDVFLLPMESLGGQQRLAGDVVLEQLHATDTSEKHCCLDNSSSSGASCSADATKSTSCIGAMPAENNDDDDEVDGDVPVIAHLTTVTCLKLIAVQPPQQEKQQQGNDAEVLITGDRDEKIRLCFASSPWNLEAAHLGHLEFITDVAPILNSSTSGSELLQQKWVVSASGDCTLRLWEMQTGRLHSQGSLALQPSSLFKEALPLVNSLLQEASPLQHNSKEALPTCAVLRGHLLPVKVFVDEKQCLIVVQVLQLKGLLLIPYNSNALQQPLQQVYGQAQVVPLQEFAAAYPSAPAAAKGMPLVEAYERSRGPYGR
ncbi:WD-40 repeat-containing protein [Cyclospora cayetanensis]|uniref:WD-40 repeat-containing protein n=1 Tax=Cyclospora cayetanensis TaxID=88456 RepID=A0A1D3CSD6_9EIME|nr:WD-40 repeat-containing protein [Cyclospora cayetanensis]